MTTRTLMLPVVVAGTMTAAVLGAAPAQAATMYGCPLSGTTVCNSPLSATVHGDVTVTADGAYSFNPSGDRTPGYVAVPGSKQIDMTRLPVTVSVQVKGIGVPSARVGDYDVVRGTPGGSWKIEVVARSSRTTALAMCFFKGTDGKGTATGGPDLNKLKDDWTTIACTDTGSAIELRVNGTLVKTTKVKTGPIPNPGPLLIGAKDTTGGDQLSGYARNVQISVP